MPRYSTSRQKVCQQCSTAKAKCDRETPGCGRCARRGFLCIYPGAVTCEDASRQDTGMNLPSIDEIMAPEHSIQNSEPSRSPRGSIASILGTDDDLTFISTRLPPTTNSPRPASATSSREGYADLEFSSLGLICPIRAEDISNRWLNTYVPLPGQTVKSYPVPITTFISQMLKSYTATIIHSHGLPPFCHPAQMHIDSANMPLLTCISLLRICDKPTTGTGFAVDILRQEMAKLFEQHASWNEMAILATFQSYLVYCMVLYFHLNQGGDSFLREASMHLQDIAGSSAKQGLVCPEEKNGARPRWEPWIAAEAKRRTLFTMYLFDSVLAAHHGTPAFLGTELEGLLAPSGKGLWRAESRRSWEVCYNGHLADWPGGGLRIDELWPAPAHIDERGIIERKCRVERWLENLDEFGTMLYAVTCCTHGV